MCDTCHPDRVTQLRYEPQREMIVMRGTRVRFHEEQGNEGPQASTVESLGAPRKAPDHKEVAQPERRP